MPTKLISMHVYLTGWYDTGRTSLSTVVAQHNYNPLEVPGKTVTDRVELYAHSAEVFLSEGAGEHLEFLIAKSVDAYISALELNTL